MFGESHELQSKPSQLAVKFVLKNVLKSLSTCCGMPIETSKYEE